MMGERKLTKEEIDRVRGIEGFPIAKDEDIIALSRPPYYTACPNPFIADFIKEHGTPYDEGTDDYHCEPFAADVSEGKNDPIYMAHTYHTKVPYKAIMRYILHYTKPGDIVLDGFCGTGMTAVAAQKCGDVTSQEEYMISRQAPNALFGRRRCIVNDLSPIATFLASNYVTETQEDLTEKIESTIANAEAELGWMYKTRHTGNQHTSSGQNDTLGTINYTIYSDVFICPSCGKEIVFWDVAVVREEGKILDRFRCQNCGAELKKTDCDRAKETIEDPQIESLVVYTKQVPVIINYTYMGKRYEKIPDEDDLSLISKINKLKSRYYVPTQPLPEGYNTEQPKRSNGIYYVHELFTNRNLLALCKIFSSLSTNKEKFVFTSVLQNATKMYKFRTDGKGGIVTGTLYIPALNQENNVFNLIRGKLNSMKKAQYCCDETYCMVSTNSTTCEMMPENCIDYIFTDPPFGANINYSELSFLWESWLNVITNNETEAIVNATQGKALLDYQLLMEKCFREYYRVLKPGRWMTVEFHNSQNAVWNAIAEALLRAGFIVADVRTLDKKQGSFKQVTTNTAVKQDLIISAYKPKESFVRQFTERAGDPEMAWEFVRQHLQNVPIAPDSTGKIEVVSERQDYLLFDRMVAFHIMNGIPVPMDAYTFYAGLRERFIQRDGMFFLADQVNEYDERRQKMELQDQQLSLFISDEKSAIMWLNVQLTQERQSYSEIQPKYLQELHQAKFEQMPELLDMLKENFLIDYDGKWYVPNLSDKADLEKLRRKRLLKDFYDIYVKGTGRIKNARTEAIRVGFDECWKERNYPLIVKVGDRLPENILQEDPALLMYYDNAASRM